jgi:hypothetical protein
MPKRQFSGIVVIIFRGHLQKFNIASRRVLNGDHWPRQTRAFLRCDVTAILNSSTGGQCYEPTLAVFLW